VGGVGSRVVFWAWPALEAACARVCVCALVLVPGVGVGARHSWRIVAGMRKLPLATVTLTRCDGASAACSMSFLCLSPGGFTLVKNQSRSPRSTLSAGPPKFNGS
jgi:hypothetical protein